MSQDSRPPLCIQILSLIVLICFGLYCIVKGASFSSFSWWLILGASCLLATAFASFRLYEVCRREEEGEEEETGRGELE